MLDWVVDEVALGHGNKLGTATCGLVAISRPSHPYYLMASTDKLLDNWLCGIVMSRVGVCRDENFHRQKAKFPAQEVSCCLVGRSLGIGDCKLKMNGIGDLKQGSGHGAGAGHDLREGRGGYGNGDAGPG